MFVKRLKMANPAVYAVSEADVHALGLDVDDFDSVFAGFP
jgi:hypothetical protein